MSRIQKLLCNIYKTNCQPLATYCISSRLYDDNIYFKSNFTIEEQTKILTTLNNSNADQLSRFEVSQNRIKNIESWKSKKGPFKSLSDVLEVDGLGEKLLHKMCESIVNGKNVEEPAVFKRKEKYKKNKQLVIPELTKDIAYNITSAVGIHLTPIGISWAKILKGDNKLVTWNFETFTCLPKKMLPDETFNQSIAILKKIPPSDVYIFETNSSTGQNNLQTSAYTEKIELNAMLLALLNTSINHNVTLKQDMPSKNIENRVFYMKSRVPARLFNTLVGQEKVAAISTVTELLEIKSTSLPCTRITMDHQLKGAFLSQSPANKELLGQALMLIVSFMDLCIYKNPVSLLALSSNRNKK